MNGRAVAFGCLLGIAASAQSLSAREIPVRSANEERNCIERTEGHAHRQRVYVNSLRYVSADKCCERLGGVMAAAGLQADAEGRMRPSVLAIARENRLVLNADQDFKREIDEMLCRIDVPGGMSVRAYRLRWVSPSKCVKRLESMKECLAVHPVEMAGLSLLFVKFDEPDRELIEAAILSMDRAPKCEIWANLQVIKVESVSGSLDRAIARVMSGSGDLEIVRSQGVYFFENGGCLNGDLQLAGRMRHYDLLLSPCANTVRRGVLPVRNRAGMSYAANQFKWELTCSSDSSTDDSRQGSLYSLTNEQSIVLGGFLAGDDSACVFRLSHRFEAMSFVEHQDEDEDCKDVEREMSEYVKGVKWIGVVGRTASVGGMRGRTPAIPLGTEGLVHVPMAFRGVPVTAIGDYAFAGCSNITSVVLPSTVTNVGRGAFFGCARLERVRLPEGVARIGENAFLCCPSLANADSIAVMTNEAYRASHTQNRRSPSPFGNRPRRKQ